MFDAMIPVDGLKQQLREEEAKVARSRARQVHLLRLLVSAQAPMRDGYASTEDWTAGLLDVSPETAAALVKVSRWPDTGRDQGLEQGRLSFDRAVAETGLLAAGVPPERVVESRSRDIAGVRRLAARHRIYDPTDEVEAFTRRHLVLQPNLDESSWRICGQLPGVDGRLVEKALHQRGDELPALAADSRPTLAQRNADALTSICIDSLTGSSGQGEDRTEPLVTVFVEAGTATGRYGMAGVHIESGPILGTQGLSELLCNGRVDFVGLNEGKALGLGDSQAVVPSRLRRFILFRDGGCVIEGCQSRYRLQIHHLVPRHRGGTNDEDNLVTLCWYHHHVVIHGHQYTIDPHSPPQRRRLLPHIPQRGPPRPRSFTPEGDRTDRTRGRWGELRHS